MTNAAPGVSIIVVTWNGRDLLAGCLAALAAQSYGDTETIVIDNGSIDGTVAMVKYCYPWVRLIENTGNVGFAAATAQALPHCRGRYIALVNNDTEANPGWLAALVAALDQAPRAAGACGTVVRLGRADQWLSTTPKIDPRAARAVWVAQPAPAWRVDTLAGNSMLMRRAVIDQIGFLDPAYVAYYEETDWCARAIRAGHDLLYEPAAVIAHREQGSATTAYHAYHMTRNQLRFALKNVEPVRLPRALILDLWAIAIDGARAMRARRTALVPVLLSAVLWNVLHLRATVRARRHDTARLGPGARPYLASLPLRGHSADGQGGLRPPLDTARGPEAHPTEV